MKITEVRVFPTESRDGKLKAFATMTFDDWFVVRNVKVIQGSNGLFVAMPSRKAVTGCPKCQFKNAVGSKYCNHCGAQQKERQINREDGHHDPQAGHMDIAHPITQECRVYIQDKILEAYNKEPGSQAKAPEPVQAPEPAPDVEPAQAPEPVQDAEPAPAPEPAQDAPEEEIAADEQPEKKDKSAGIEEKEEKKPEEKPAEKEDKKPEEKPAEKEDNEGLLGADGTQDIEL